jgi:two-component sensor histidine kinase
MQSTLISILELARQLRTRIEQMEGVQEPVLALSFDERKRFEILMRRLRRHAEPFISNGGRH